MDVFAFMFPRILILTFSTNFVHFYGARRPVDKAARNAGDIFAKYQE